MADTRPMIEKVYEVICPYCDAPPGQHCVTARRTAAGAGNWHMDRSLAVWLKEGSLPTSIRRPQRTRLERAGLL